MPNYDKYAQNPTTGQIYGLTQNQWVPITKAQYDAAHEGTIGPQVAAPGLKTSPGGSLANRIAFLKKVWPGKPNPAEAAQQWQATKSALPPIAAGVATTPFGGEGVWPIILRILAAGGASGLTTKAMGGSNKESGVSALEQGGLQGLTEGSSSALKMLGKKLLAGAAKDAVTIAGKDFPLIRGQSEAGSTATGKVARGMSESFVGGPIAKRLEQQDQMFKALISDAAAKVGGVKGNPENFIENTFSNAQSVIDKAGKEYDAVAGALPDKLTPEEEKLQAAYERMKGFELPTDPRFKASVMASLTPEEKIAIQNPEEKIVPAAQKYANLQKARSAASAAANAAFKKGLQGGSFADYAARRAETDALDQKIVSLLSKENPALAKQYLAANALHAQGRGIERFGMMLDSLTSGLSKAEAAASGVPVSEIPSQKIDYGRALEAIREFNSRGHFDTDPVLNRLYGKQAANDILRSANLVNKSAKSSLGIVAHYATTVGPAMGAAAEVFRGNPHAAATALATYPALWTVAKLLSYPSFAEPFGKLMASAADTRDASLWAIRSVQAANAILRSPQRPQAQTAAQVQ